MLNEITHGQKGHNNVSVSLICGATFQTKRCTADSKSWYLVSNFRYGFKRNSYKYFVSHVFIVLLASSSCHIAIVTKRHEMLLLNLNQLKTVTLLKI